MALDPNRLSIPELGALRCLIGALADLRTSEESLQLYQQAAPTPERAALLTAVARAIRELEVVPLPEIRPETRPWESRPSG
jgi:hypothetical protein